jgi:diadenosine tetraphosphate (Ap4A) HIT family hydrolase
MHLHVHIMPRFVDDSFQHWHGDEPYHDDERGDEVATNIRRKIEK